MSEDKQQTPQSANTNIDDTFLDNGDHMWEYYVGGKLLTEEEMQNAHTSYYKA